MKCHECRDLLSPYLDNMTSDEENKRITVHLAACRSCYRDMQEMKLMLEGLGFYKGEVALPDGYTEELHEKLLAHKTSLWGKQQAIPAPRTGGWVAASVAALALGGGIWISSMVPLAQVADNLQKVAPAIFDRQKEQIKPLVEKLIAEKAQDMQKQNTGTTTQQGSPGKQIAVNEPTQPDKTGTDTNKPNVTPPKTSVGSPAAVAEIPRVAPVVAMRVNVENLDTAVGLVKLEGDSQNTMVAVNDNSIRTLTAGRDRLVSIQVPESQVEAWTKWLSGLGESTAPSNRTEDLTKEYSQLSQKITSLEQQLAAKSSDELKAELQTAQKQLDSLKERLNFVTINVTLHEDLDP